MSCSATATAAPAVRATPAAAGARRSAGSGSPNGNTPQDAAHTSPHDTSATIHPRAASAKRHERPTSSARARGRTSKQGERRAHRRTHRRRSRGCRRAGDRWRRRCARRRRSPTRSPRRSGRATAGAGSRRQPRRRGPSTVSRRTVPFMWPVSSAAARIPRQDRHDDQHHRGIEQRPGTDEPRRDRCSSPAPSATARPSIGTARSPPRGAVPRGSTARRRSRRGRRSTPISMATHGSGTSAYASRAPIWARREPVTDEHAPGAEQARRRRDRGPRSAAPARTRHRGSRPSPPMQHHTAAGGARAPEIAMTPAAPPLVEQTAGRVAEGEEVADGRHAVGDQGSATEDDEEGTTAAAISRGDPGRTRAHERAEVLVVGPATDLPAYERVDADAAGLLQRTNVGVSGADERPECLAPRPDLAQPTEVPDPRGEDVTDVGKRDRRAGPERPPRGAATPAAAASAGATGGCR